MMNNLMILLLIISISFISCDNDDEQTNINETNCGQFAIVDNDLFESEPNANFQILSAAINNDCLELNVSSGGCSGETWTVELYDSENIAESLPVQRFLRLDMINLEVCNAIVNQIYTFDLTPIQTEQESEILLNIEGWEDLVLYEY